ncbi:hypothetical protein M514_11756 [Trichuris suis]|uniref:Uncharacterized protein n=1 Tax=Trichuris suis TaxID=68888 RepID=A0A085LQZ7_9BILA|nr:hypothetical protein M513_11756 [Trichuris suis]KFD61366.1 hypothetical protein M514_11756 [Trichuris suis]
MNSSTAYLTVHSKTPPVGHMSHRENHCFMECTDPEPPASVPVPVAWFPSPAQSCTHVPPWHVMVTVSTTGPAQNLQCVQEPPEVACC